MRGTESPRPVQEWGSQHREGNIGSGERSVPCKDYVTFPGDVAKLVAVAGIMPRTFLFIHVKKNIQIMEQKHNERDLLIY